MFKKLFGKKNSILATPQDIRIELIETIKEESLSKYFDKHLNRYIDSLTEENSNDVAILSEELLELISDSSNYTAITALSAISSLSERGYYNESIVNKVIAEYKDLLEITKPFFDIFCDKIKNGESGDADYEIDADSLYHELIKDENLISAQIRKSISRLDGFSKYILSILSMDLKSNIRYYNELKDYIIDIISYKAEFYWIDRLLNILYEEPILVIDIDNNRGFTGKINGVSDNYQLMHLLMSLPQLNESPAISESDLKVIDGRGIHVSNSVITGKWNMYNYGIIDIEGWEEIKIGPAKTYDLQDFWIWGEGTPSEISVHNGYRIILLGRSPIQRQTRLQRTFQHVRANIEVEKVLTEEEIKQWLKLN